MADGEPVPGSLFIYAPNQGAPVFFTVAFAVSAAGHIWQCHRYKAWKLIGLHPLCAVLFTAGYALREYGSFNFLYEEDDKTNLLVFIMSQVFIYVCPPLLELANYHILGRIFYYVPYLAPLPASRVLSTFGALMAVIELLNSLGVALAANPSSSESTQELGGHLIVAAIAIQLVIIVVFVPLAALFHRRCARRGLLRRSRVVGAMLGTLYASMLLIFVRCVYRLVEHTGSTSVDLGDVESLRELSPILRYEWFFYVFEGTLMLLNSVLWNYWHPGRFLPRNYHVYLSTDGTEVEGAEAKDDRTATQVVLSVVTFGIMYRRKVPGPPFEELEELNGSRGTA